MRWREALSTWYTGRLGPLEGAGPWRMPRLEIALHAWIIGVSALCWGVWRLVPAWDPGPWALVPWVPYVALLTVALPMSHALISVWLEWDRVPSTVEMHVAHALACLRRTVAAQTPTLVSTTVALSLLLAGDAGQSLRDSLRAVGAVALITGVAISLQLALPWFLRHLEPRRRPSPLRLSLLQTLLWRTHQGVEDLPRLLAVLEHSPDPAAMLTRLHRVRAWSVRPPREIARTLLTHPDREVRLWGLQHLALTAGPAADEGMPM